MTSLLIFRIKDEIDRVARRLAGLPPCAER
jgi:hypothetical protein